MPKYIIFDTETTGIKEQDRIIQIACMIIDETNKAEIFEDLCSCDVQISLEAMETHHITSKLLKDKPKLTLTQCYKKIEENNKNSNYLVAHNINFDLGMIEKEGFINQYKLIDTLRCARHLLKDAPHHRLQYLRYYLELFEIEDDEAKKYNIEIKAHDALGDVLVTKLLLSKLIEIVKNEYKSKDAMQVLEELTKTPIFVKTFKFGKYKGRDINEIYKEDKNYISWMMNNLTLDEDLQYTLDILMENE